MTSLKPEGRYETLDTGHGSLRTKFNRMILADSLMVA